MQGRFFITFYKLSDNRKESTILRLFYFAMMFGNKTKQKSVLLLQFAMMMTIQTHTHRNSQYLNEDSFNNTEVQKTYILLEFTIF